MKVNRILGVLSIIVLLGLAGWAVRTLPEARTSAPAPASRTLLQNRKPDRFEPSTWQVLSVPDGDTIRVHRGSQVLRVRFACIDAPELPHTKQERASYNRFDLNQFKWGRLARNELMQLITQAHNKVVLTIIGSDRYGRKIAEVRLPDGTLLQEVLAREGLVMVYPQYIKGCPSAALVEQSEYQARKEKVGIWGNPQFTPPWEYRRMRRIAHSASATSAGRPSLTNAPGF